MDADIGWLRHIPATRRPDVCLHGQRPYGPVQVGRYDWYLEAAVDSASRLFLLVSLHVPMFTLFFAHVNMYMCNRNFFQLFVPVLTALITA